MDTWGIYLWVKLPQNEAADSPSTNAVAILPLFHTFSWRSAELPTGSNVTFNAKMRHPVIPYPCSAENLWSPSLEVDAANSVACERNFSLRICSSAGHRMQWIIFDLWIELLLYKKDLHSFEDLSKKGRIQKEEFWGFRGVWGRGWEEVE